jgi:hypothetical protein
MQRYEEVRFLQTSFGFVEHPAHVVGQTSSTSSRRRGHALRRGCRGRNGALFLGGCRRRSAPLSALRETPSPTVTLFQSSPSPVMISSSAGATGPPSSRADQRRQVQPRNFGLFRLNGYCAVRSW